MKKFIQLLIIILTSSSFAQDGTIDFNFNPSTGTNNNVNSTVIQTDGKIIVGGIFTQLNNTTCNRLGRLNSDGTLDNTFILGSGFNNDVNSVCVQSDGKIVVGGNFTTYNGISINRIVRLNTDGTIDSTFNIGTGVNDRIYTIAIQSDGKILIGGDFTSYNGNLKRKIVRLNVDGTIDSTFNITTGANNTIYSCILQSDSKIIIAGSFTLFNGIARSRIARLNLDGTLDATFNTGSGAANSTIKSVCLQSDGRIIIGGEFTTYNGISANYIARLNSNSTLDTTFNIGTGFNYFVNAIIIQSDGKLVVGGYFGTFNGVNCDNLVRLNVDGTRDSNFNSGTNSYVTSVTIQSDGKILLGGNFTSNNGIKRNNLTRINTNGSIDNSYYPFFQNGNGANGDIRSMAVQSDQKILIGGFFSSYNGLTSNNIARLNSDGTLDATFNVGTGTNLMVKKIAVLPNNKIIIIGNFTTYNGVTCNRIARLNADGTLDTTFNVGGSGADDYIHTVSIQTDGKIIIGGDFQNINGFARFRFARLNENGTVDTSFNVGGTGPEGSVHTTAIQPDGKIIIGGIFSSYNNTISGCMTRLNINGTRDTTFNPGGSGADYFVYSISIQNNGKIIIGGSFTKYNNVVLVGTGRLVRLNSNGSIDTSFNCSIMYGNGTVYDTLIQADGKIIVGGAFSPGTGFNGNNIMRLNTDGSLDNNFMSGIGFSGYITAVSLQNDGKILAGGNFFYYNGTLIDNLARLNSTNNLSLVNFNNDFKIIVYPNPVNDYLKFSLPDDVNALSFEVFDVIGKKIHSNFLNTNVLNVNNYRDGIYFLHLKTNKGIMISKFIKN